MNGHIKGESNIQSILDKCSKNILSDDEKDSD